MGKIAFTHTEAQIFYDRRAVIALFLNFLLEKIGTINPKTPYIYELIISGFL